MMTTAQDRSDDSLDLDFRILGPVVVTVNGSPVDIATRRQRALLVLLLLNVGRVVPAERLIEQLWDGSPPPQAPVTLRSYVSNLRQTLAPTGLGAALVTRGAGYMMDVPPATIDATRLRTLTERGRDLLRRGEPLQGLPGPRSRRSPCGAGTRWPRSLTTRSRRAASCSSPRPTWAPWRAGSRR